MIKKTLYFGNPIYLSLKNARKHSIFRLDAHYSQTYLCAITK